MSKFTNQNSSIDKNESPDIKRLFNQAAVLYSNEPFSPKTKKDIQASLSHSGNCFILKGDEYIFPDYDFKLPPTLVRPTIVDDQASAFRRKIDHDGHMKTLFTCYIGRNRDGEDITAGMLCSDLLSQITGNEAAFYNYTGTLKRFYIEFTGSRTILNFLENKKSYLYAVNGETAQIIFRRIPEDIDLDSENIQADNQIVESILPRILHSQQAADELQLDNRLKNLELHKCTIYNANIILLSLTMVDYRHDRSFKFDPVITGFSQKIKDKIGAIRSAADVLNLQKDQPLDENNLALLENINSASKDLEKLVNRLDLYADKETADDIATE